VDKHIYVKFDPPIPLYPPMDDAEGADDDRRRRLAEEYGKQEPVYKKHEPEWEQHLNETTLTED